MYRQSKSVSNAPALFAVAGLVVLGLVMSQRALFRADQYAPDPVPPVALRLEAPELLVAEPPVVTVYIVSSSETAAELESLLAQQQVTEPPTGGYSIAIAQSAEDTSAIVSYLYGSTNWMPHVLAFFGEGEWGG